MHHLHPFLPHLELWIESWLSAAGPIIVFIVTFVEGIPPIGLLAPTNTIIIFASFLAKIGALRFDIVILAALCGMVLGDSVGYFLGKRYGYAFLFRLGRIFSVSRESVEKLKNLVSGHLTKSVFIGKFNPLTRSLTPFVVGASKVSFARFISLDFLVDAFLIALAAIIGYAFGASYVVVGIYVGRIIVIGLVISILIAVSYRFIDGQFHVFAKYELFALIFNILALSGFVIMLQGISARYHFMINPDIGVNIWFDNLVHGAPWLVLSATFTSNIFSPLVLAIVAIGLSVYFFIKNRWRHFFIVLLSLVSGYILTEFLKNAIGIPRPPDALVHLSDFSFPSGHATGAAIALVLIMYFLVPKLKSKSIRWFLIIGIFILALLVGASRLVLGVHWLSDVIAGYSLGIFSATAMILLVRYGGLVWKAVMSFEKSEGDRGKVD